MNRTHSSPIHSIEICEVIQKLKDAGYSDIVDCLLDNEKDCYTKKGRLNKSSTCRKLNWKGKKLEDALKQMRLVLKNEFDISEEDEEDFDDSDE